MRIIHEIDGEIQTTASGRPWSTAVRSGDFEYRGFRAELVAVVNCFTKHEEAIYIEGNAAQIRRVLTDWLRALDTMESLMREEHERRVAAWREAHPA